MSQHSNQKMNHHILDRMPSFLKPGCLFASATLCTSLLGVALAGPTSVDLSTYILVGRYDLPEPTRTVPPLNSLLAQEASSITYDWDTDTLFVLGDGGTSVVQVTRTGQLIDSMTLAPGNSPQGTDFYDTEGLSYVGNGNFVLVEERDRQVVLFTYVGGGTLHRADVKTVKLGTTIGNIGFEGITYDPLTGNFIIVKEKDPQSIFLASIDFARGTASNGSPTATSSIDLFDPKIANVVDFSDVFALSNLPSLAGQPDASHLLVISQESGQIIHVDRSGIVYSRLTIKAPAGSPLSVPDMTMEGVTMDGTGNLYVVNENGGGDVNHPQLWVYAHTDQPNLAPTGIALLNQISSIPANTSTAAAVKVAEIAVLDDGLGRNDLLIGGPDANTFQIIGAALYLKAGTPLNATTKPTYAVTISVDDPNVGSSPDAVANFSLTVTPAQGGTPSLIISEVAPWSSGNSPSNLRVDWFEVSNVGTAAQDITGWKMDDNSFSFGSAVALNGISTIAPGESVIFLETADNNPATITAKKQAFRSVWFGGNPPPNLQIGTYSGSGVGLSTGGDAVNLYNPVGGLQASVTFGVSPAGPFSTFDNANGLNNATIGALSAVGVHGAFIASGDSNEIGSPGTLGFPTTPVVSIVAIDPNASEVGSDPGTFRISRTGSVVGSLTVNYTFATGSGQASASDYSNSLNGSATIPSGSTFVDLFLVPTDDNLLEGIETVSITLFDTGSYDVGSPAKATVSIADDVRIPSAAARVNVSRSGFLLDRRTGFFVQTDTLTNTSGSPIPGPLYLVLDNLSANASLPGKSGVTANAAPLGSPYVQILGPNGTLSAGASLAVTLNFSNPNRIAINYSTRVLAGGNTTP